MSQASTIYFPPQKLPSSKKTEEWAKKCVEAGEDLAIFRFDGIRSSYREKVINYGLANDELDTSDMEKVCNPMGIKGGAFPATMQNYPIANPKIDLLVGEERKRRFDWYVRVTNSDAISQKETEKKNQLMAYMQKVITDEGFNEQEVQAELAKLQKYQTYEFQDSRERTATHILKYLWGKLDLKEEFAKGFEDALIAGEEIYCADLVAGEPVLRKVNPLNLHTVRGGESPWIEDSDIIVEDGYYSPGQVIDLYNDVLKPEHIKMIDEGTTQGESDGMISIGEKEPSLLIDGLFDPNQTGSRPYGEFWDSDGNLRVTRTLWKSFKKVGTLTWYDEEGMQQKEVVSEGYKVDKEKGEEVKWFWINEWWEGTRIGKSIYVKLQPRPIQFRNITNPSICNPGYTGIAYNINSSKAKSLMERMKPYQYLYNVFMYRTELAFAKAKGRIASLDLAQVPDGWDIDKWMYYAEVNGWAVRDSFKEAKRGVAQGKLAGQMNVQSDVINLELGNYIQQHIMMLQFIEQQLGKIAGVSEQRQGQVENRELVGNVERAISQSSHITEKWFAIHNNVKKKAMGLLLDTAKLAWSKEGSDQKLQYVTDDMGTAMFNIDPAQFNSAEYGLTISDASNDAEMVQTLKGLAQAGLQNDKLNFSQIIDIYSTESIASMKRKIQQAELEKQQRDEAQQQQAQQMQQQAEQAAQQAQQAQQQFEITKIDTEYGHKKEIELLKISGNMNSKLADHDRDGIPDILESEKVASQERIKLTEIQLKREAEDKKIAQQEKDRQTSISENEKDRKNKLALEDKKIKAKPKPVAK